MAAPSLDELEQRYAEQKVGSIFIYTNEAHPGERYPHHASMEQKLAHAAALVETYGIERPVLVDAWEGHCHQAYGGMPNMTWIFNRACRPVYKSNWTDAASVDNALTHLTGIGERRRDGERVLPTLVERLEYRTSDREGFYAGLEKAGPKAIAEYDALFGQGWKRST